MTAIIGDRRRIAAALCIAALLSATAMSAQQPDQERNRWQVHGVGGSSWGGGGRVCIGAVCAGLDLTVNPDPPSAYDEESELDFSVGVVAHRGSRVSIVLAGLLGYSTGEERVEAGACAAPIRHGGDSVLLRRDEFRTAGAALTVVIVGPETRRGVALGLRYLNRGGVSAILGYTAPF
ncbi:hypothetical protein [Candidatus Palauibacter sp.]|uniref:hypothetical protein n=1 Tax=Candidatus Palauibacter sp. TaxID=3101350 RepID=UPI003CC56106